jgi:hypothetical protein
MYDAYLCKEKPFWYFLNKFLLYLVLPVGVLFVIIGLQNIYENYLGYAVLLLIIWLIGIGLTRYKLDGSLTKPWWEIY